MITAFQMHILH